MSTNDNHLPEAITNFPTGSNPKQRNRRLREKFKKTLADNKSHANRKGYNWNTGVSRVRVGNITYSRNQIAAGTGIDRAHVARVFAGKSRLSLDSALRISNFFKISVEELMAVVIPTNVKLIKVQEEKRKEEELKVFIDPKWMTGYTPVSHTVNVSPGINRKPKD